MRSPPTAFTMGVIKANQMTRTSPLPRQCRAHCGRRSYRSCHPHLRPVWLHRTAARQYRRTTAEYKNKFALGEPQRGCSHSEAITSQEGLSQHSLQFSLRHLRTGQCRNPVLCGEGEGLADGDHGDNPLERQWEGLAISAREVQKIRVVTRSLSLSLTSRIGVRPL